MKVSFEPEFELGETVYLIHDPEDMPRFVIGYLYTIDGAIKYVLSSIDSDSFHYEFEISEQKRSLRN